MLIIRAFVLFIAALLTAVVSYGQCKVIVNPFYGTLDCIGGSGSGTIATTTNPLVGDGAGNAVAATITGTGSVVLSASPTITGTLTVTDTRPSLSLFRSDSATVTYGGIKWQTSQGTVRYSLDSNNNAGEGFEFNKASSTLMYIQGSTGYVGIGPSNTSPTGTAHIYDATATTGSTKLTVKAGAGQSGNLLEILNNAGSVLTAITSAGMLTVSGGVDNTTWNAALINNTGSQGNANFYKSTFRFQSRDGVIATMGACGNTFTGLCLWGKDSTSLGEVGHIQVDSVGNILLGGIKSTTGKLYLCVDTSGNVTKNTSCTGT